MDPERALVIPPLINLQLTCPESTGQMTQQLAKGLGKESEESMSQPYGIPLHLEIYAILATVSFVLYLVRFFYFKEEAEEEQEEQEKEEEEKGPSLLDMLLCR